MEPKAEEEEDGEYDVSKLSHSKNILIPKISIDGEISEPELLEDDNAMHATKRG